MSVQETLLRGLRRGQAGNLSLGCGLELSGRVPQLHTAPVGTVHSQVRTAGEHVEPIWKLLCSYATAFSITFINKIL